MTTPIPQVISVNLQDIAQTITHDLSHPTISDEEVLAGLQICRKYSIAAVIVKPYHILYALKHLEGTITKVSALVGPGGGGMSEVKVFEAQRAVEEGAHEVEMGVNLGRAKSGKWIFVAYEVNKLERRVRERTSGKAVVGVGVGDSENLSTDEFIKLCDICSEAGIKFLSVLRERTSNAIADSIKMEKLNSIKYHLKGLVTVKVDGVRTLDELLKLKATGFSRVGTRETENIMKKAIEKGIGKERVEVKLDGVDYDHENIREKM
ncbi:hypothetical protein B0O99DRAFT_632226 [Bisporella sp. PMI_857]|nr:hypothetical protein B0O99DRAFT_632226 [Bisporella sp. PMI_857]